MAVVLVLIFAGRSARTRVPRPWTRVPRRLRPCRQRTWFVRCSSYAGARSVECSTCVRRDFGAREPISVHSHRGDPTLGAQRRGLLALLGNSGSNAGWGLRRRRAGRSWYAGQPAIFKNGAPAMQRDQQGLWAGALRHGWRALKLFGVGSRRRHCPPNATFPTVWRLVGSSVSFGLFSGRMCLFVSADVARGDNALAFPTFRRRGGCPGKTWRGRDRVPW